MIPHLIPLMDSEACQHRSNQTLIALTILKYLHHQKEIKGNACGSDKNTLRIYDYYILAENN